MREHPHDMSIDMSDKEVKRGLLFFSKMCELRGEELAGVHVKYSDSFFLVMKVILSAGKEIYCMSTTCHNKSCNLSI